MHTRRQSILCCSWHKQQHISQEMTEEKKTTTKTKQIERVIKVCLWCSLRYICLFLASFNYIHSRGLRPAHRPFENNCRWFSVLQRNKTVSYWEILNLGNSRITQCHFTEQSDGAKLHSFSTYRETSDRIGS